LRISLGQLYNIAWVEDVYRKCQNFWWFAWKCSQIRWINWRKVRTAR